MGKQWIDNLAAAAALLGLVFGLLVIWVVTP